MVVLAGTALFYLLAYAVEVPWMERMGSNGTGTAIATAWLTAPALLLLIAVMLIRFRETRLPALLGWTASLPLFAGLFAATYSLAYCSIPGC
jgi:hypothetical protein